MANDKNKLYITISDGRGEKPTSGDNNGKEDKEESSALGRYAEHQFFHLAKNQVMQAVNFNISNIGNFTGNYALQRRVNAMKQTVSGIMTVGISTFAGAKYGPVGAAIGFVIGAASLATSTIYDFITSNVENQKTNYEIEQLRQRSGLNTILDGSRGTEN